MDFKEAIKSMKNGKSIRRRSWAPFNYIKLEKVTYEHEGAVIDQEEVRDYHQETVPFIYSSNIVLSDKWQIVGQDPSSMFDFPEAIEMVFKQNAKIKLEEWNNNTWLELAEDRKTLNMKKMQDYRMYHFDFHSMTASDWEISE